MIIKLTNQCILKKSEKPITVEITIDILYSLDIEIVNLIKKDKNYYSNRSKLKK